MPTTPMVSNRPSAQPQSLRPTLSLGLECSSRSQSQIPFASIMNVNIMDPTEREKFLALRREAAHQQNIAYLKSVAEKYSDLAEEDTTLRSVLRNANAAEEQNSELNDVSVTNTPNRRINFNPEEESFLARVQRTPASTRQRQRLRPPTAKISSCKPPEAEASTSDPNATITKEKPSLPYRSTPIISNRPSVQPQSLRPTLSLGPESSGSHSQIPFPSIMNVNIMDPNERAKFFALRREAAHRQNMAYLKSVAEKYSDLAEEDPALRSALRNASAVDELTSELKDVSITDTPKRTINFNPEEESFLARVQKTPLSMRQRQRLRTPAAKPANNGRPNAAAIDPTLTITKEKPVAR